MSRALLRRRVGRLTSALVPITAPTQTVSAIRELPEDGARALAVEIARAFGAFVDYYREHHAMSPDEARAKAAETPDHYIERSLSCDPSQVSWLDIDARARIDAQKAPARWEEVKEAARGEVRTGDRAARAIEGYDLDCWRRARYLAVRAELTEAWRPRNAAEQHLIDQMAQSQDLMWKWQESLTAYHQMVMNGTREFRRKDGEIEPPQLSYVEAMERAASMVERFHAVYLRSLAALQRLRRLPPVVVRSAGQVNIGQQQVNM